MNFTQLSYIDSVHRCGSLSAAAKDLGVSQQALSKSIIAFERETGLNVFHRSKMGMTPTEEGVAVLEGIRKVLDEAAFLVSTIEHIKQRKPVSPLVDIRVPEGFIGGDQSPLPMKKLVDFSAAHPQVEYQVSELPAMRIAREVQLGLFDAGIVLGDIPPRCRGRLVFSSLLKAVVSKKSPLGSKSELSWGDLEGISLVISPDSLHTKVQIEQECSAHGFEARFLSPVSQFEGNVSFAATEQAVLLCHDEGRIRSIGQDAVAVIPFKRGERIDYVLSFVWPEAKGASQEREAFGRFLEETLSHA